jgi:hypothetical protein
MAYACLMIIHASLFRSYEKQIRAGEKQANVSAWGRKRKPWIKGQTIDRGQTLRGQQMDMEELNSICPLLPLLQKYSNEGVCLASFKKKSLRNNAMNSVTDKTKEKKRNAKRS